jgi:hypothetical protein
MKFISAKKVQDHAYRLHEVQKQMAELQSKLKDLKAEADALETFLDARTNGENFQFADPEGYLMETDFVLGARTDIDGAAVRRIFAKMGKKVPMKRAEWVNVKVKYILE